MSAGCEYSFFQEAFQMVEFFQGKHQGKKANYLGKFQSHRLRLPSENMAPCKLKNFSLAS